MANTSGKALIDFWQSPLAVSATTARLAADLATACKEVLSVRSDGGELNVQAYPLEELFRELEELRPHYTKSTLAAYKSRFRKAVRLYLAYLEDPVDWSRAVEFPRPRRKDQSIWQRYQFPLRGDATLPLDLPLDITRSEASRLSEFIKSLVIR
jgi:hypothetical protein